MDDQNSLKTGKEHSSGVGIESPQPPEQGFKGVHKHSASCRYLGCAMTDFDNQIRERHGTEASDTTERETEN